MDQKMSRRSIPYLCNFIQDQLRSQNHFFILMPNHRIILLFIVFIDWQQDAISRAATRRGPGAGGQPLPHHFLPQMDRFKLEIIHFLLICNKKVREFWTSARPLGKRSNFTNFGPPPANPGQAEYHLRAYFLNVHTG